MKYLLKLKLIIASIILGVLPVACIGAFSLFKFDSFAKETISQSYKGLEEQAYYNIQSDVNEHVQKIEPIIKRSFQYTKGLADSPNITNFFNAELRATNKVKETSMTLLKGLLKTCMIHYSLKKKQVDLAFYSLGYIIDNMGRIYLSTTEQEEWNVLNNISMQKKKYVLPQFLIGIEPVYKYYNYEEDFCPIVDDIQEMTGAYCSIFQKIDDKKFLRIATNLQNKEGNRAIETLLPIYTKYGEPNPVVEKISLGQNYEGTAFEVNKNFISIYKPIYNDSGYIIGAFFVGIPCQDESLEEAIRRTKINDDGYSMVIDSKGEILIHTQSEIQGKNIFKDKDLSYLKEIFLNADKTKGKINYNSFVNDNNNQFFIAYSYIPERKWFVCVNGKFDIYLKQEIEKSKNMILQEMENISSSTTILLNNKSISTIRQISFFDQRGNELVSINSDSQKKIQKENPDLIIKANWFKKSLNLPPGNVFNAGLIISKQTDKVEMLITSPVYNYDLKGVIAVKYDWELMQDILKQKNYWKTGFALIVDNDGVIITHPEFSFKKPVKISDKKFGKLSEGLAKKISKKEHGFGKYIKDEVEHYIYFRVLCVGQLKFSFGAIVPVDEFLVLANRIKMTAEFNFNAIFRIITLSLILCISLALIIGILVSRSISDPVISVVNYAQTVSKGDLSKTLKEYRTDEIGVLIISINAMVKSFRKIVDDVIANSEHLANSADNMVKIAGELTSNTEKISTQTNNVASASEQMSTNINSIATAIEEMSSNIKRVTRSTKEMSESMEFVASFLEQMSISMEDVGNNARKGSLISEEAMKMSNLASNTMKILGQSAEEISSVTSLIKQIAERTEILAVNAAIEASAAGDAGKGFSVVAGEITKFADQSANAAGEIASSISKVQKNTRKAIKVIDNVSSIINEMNQSSLIITAAVEEQTESSNEIVNQINLARTNAKNIANAMNELDIGIVDISKSSGYAAVGSVEITNNIQGLNRATMNNNESTRNVNAYAVELDRLAGGLQKLVETFFYSNKS